MGRGKDVQIKNKKKYIKIDNSFVNCVRPLGQVFWSANVREMSSSSSITRIAGSAGEEEGRCSDMAGSGMRDLPS